MTTIEAYEDACRTVRHWQTGSATMREIRGQLGIRSHTAGWQQIIEFIVLELLLEADGGQYSLPLAVAA